MTQMDELKKYGLTKNRIYLIFIFLLLIIVLSVVGCSNNNKVIIGAEEQVIKTNDVKIDEKPQQTSSSASNVSYQDPMMDVMTQVSDMITPLIIIAALAPVGLLMFKFMRGGEI